MGYFRGWVDEMLSRIVEAFLSIPVILLAIMVLVVVRAQPDRDRRHDRDPVHPDRRPNGAIGGARRGRARLRDLGEAARRTGLFIMTREILPNITGVIVVEFTVRVGYAIFTVATLAFLGLTADDATAADWGRDVSDTYELIQSGQWWPSLFPVARHRQPRDRRQPDRRLARSGGDGMTAPDPPDCAATEVRT